MLERLKEDARLLAARINALSDGSDQAGVFRELRDALNQRARDELRRQLKIPAPFEPWPATKFKS